MRQREEIIKAWLDMWLGQELLPLEAVFTPVSYTHLTLPTILLV